MADDNEAQSDLKNWQDGTFEWNAEEDAYGNYVVEPNDLFAPTKVADALGNEMGAGDYTVVYFKDQTADGSGIDNNDPIVKTIVGGGKAMSGVPGGMPTEVGSYFAVVIKTPLPEGYVAQDNNTWANWNTASLVYKAQAFEVKASPKSLEGAYAFEGTDVNDTTFMYTGEELTVGFAVDGKALTAGTDYSVTWVSANPTGAATAAGSYEAVLVGENQYAGSRATVKFDVAKIDLSTAVLSMDYVEKGDLTFDMDIDGKITPGKPNPDLKVNGEAVASDVFNLSVVSWTDDKGATTEGNDGLTGEQGAARDYFVKATPAIPNNASIVGDYATFHAVVVNEIANVMYDDEALFADGTVFNASKNEKFDPALITAETAAGKAVKTVVSVTKDGKEVTSYDEPGEYVLTVDVKAPGDLSYGAHEVVKFNVVSRLLPATTVYAAVDGKSVNGNAFPYTGSAIVPTVVVKTANATLAAGEDYEVSYKDAKGADVESIVEPGVYTGTVSYLGAYDKDTKAKKADQTFQVTVDKATVKSGKSVQDVYAYTGETVIPKFVAYTGADLDGASVELDAATAGARYFKASWNDVTKTWDRTTTEVAAASLSAEGHYYADVTVPSSDPHFQGAVKGILFEISKTAGYNDVAADAWYADSVYKAAENGYMQGVAEGVFAPEQPMTRAEFARVVFNMAGGVPNGAVEYPTQFSDVPANAWFAQAVEWAARYGIVTGKSATEFDPYGTITREEIATMLYRYAGNGAQADLSALDAFVDGAQVSGWAANAVAWAVEEGYMNGKGANDLQPQETASRAEIAALSVRVQPEAL